MWYCYLLRCVDEKHPNSTYGGSTNDVERRIRQHNGLISGGAKATRGKTWEIYALVTGFIDHQNCLSAEWRMNHVTGKRGKRPMKYCGVHGRIHGLSDILKLDKWTSKCKYNNNDGNFKVYVVEDVIDDIDIDGMPDNVEVFTVKKFTTKILQILKKDNDK
jgi:predicted GIY-YIG superfamily endonuclease